MQAAPGKVARNNQMVPCCNKNGTVENGLLARLAQDAPLNRGLLR